MKKTNAGRLLMAATAVGTILAVPVLAAAQEAGDASRTEAQVRETVMEFKAALQNGDVEAAMAILHTDVRIFEGGHSETRGQYQSGHLEVDMAFARDVESATTWDRVVLGGQMALYLNEYTLTGEFHGRPIEMQGTETIVLIPTDRGWKIRHIHWSSR